MKKNNKMDNKTIKKLEILKSVRPDNEFKDSTRRLILATTPEVKVFSLPKLAFSAILAVAILAVTGLGIFDSKHPVLASFDELKQEYEDLTSTLEIEEIEYRQNVNNTISSALKEISSSEASHLNQSLIEEERDQINFMEEDNEEEVDDLLNQIIF
ncbi:MAG: hypothetical protein WD095_01750 [Candidatus Paceibacterota bacterium]